MIVFDSLTVFVVLALAAYRLTRLVVVDTLWQDTRERLLANLAVAEDRPLRERPLREQLDRRPLKRRKRTLSEFAAMKLRDLLECPFCVGVWACIAVVLVFEHGGVVGEWVVGVAGLAGLQAIASSIDARLNS